MISFAVKPGAALQALPSARLRSIVTTEKRQRSWGGRMKTEQSSSILQYYRDALMDIWSCCVTCPLSHWAQNNSRIAAGANYFCLVARTILK